MTTTMLNPDVEQHAARRARNAALIERAVHGVGEWTLQDPDGKDLVVALQYVLDEHGFPSMRAEWVGEPRYVDRFSLCHEGLPVQWFDLGMLMHPGDEVTVTFA